MMYECTLKKKKQIQNDALVRAGLLLQHISN